MHENLWLALGSQQTSKESIVAMRRLRTSSLVLIEYGVGIRAGEHTQH